VDICGEREGVSAAAACPLLRRRVCYEADCRYFSAIRRECVYAEYRKADTQRVREARRLAGAGVKP